MSRILVSGSMAYDRIMNFGGLFKDHFLSDKLHNLNISFQVDTMAEHFGGTAGNIAYNLALLGEKPTILSNAGSDFEKYREHLEKTGISAEPIAIIPETFTSVAHIVTDRGDNQIAAFYMGAGEIPYKKPVEIAPRDVLIVGAGNITDMETLPRMAKKAGASYLFDPGQAIPALSQDVLRNGVEGASVLFVNDYELAMISKKTEWSEADISKRVGTLIVTLGAEGSRVITKEGEVRVAAVKTSEVKDPTGAGDAYRAGYIKGIALGRQPAECAELASATAVYAVESVGTQEHTYTLADLKARFEKTYGKMLEI
ncbi:MAG: adenosine kinase [Parcubacteria group bacterium Gr01-1014_8]|nr:MAG: adenosine kinase [Parcubacteria group bacterium Gr01-1014_8]